MKKILILFFVIAIGFVLAACGDASTAQSAGEQIIEETSDNQASSEQTTTTELTVWGMTCNRCANQVINAVSAAEGVVDVIVDVSADRVTIEHEPELDVDIIKNVIEAEGYNIP